MKRITFKEGTHTILVPTIISFELKKLIQKEVHSFLKKYKINKKSRISFEYNGGTYFDFKITK